MRPPIAIAGLQASGDREQAPVDREQVRLRRRAVICHRDSQEHLPLALRVPDRAPAVARLRPADIARELGSIVEEPDDPPVERVDPSPQPAELGGLIRASAA